MDQKEEIVKELKEISPKLAEIKKNDPILVDEQYFYHLKENILVKVSNDSKTTIYPTHFLVRIFLKKWFYSAGGLLVILILIITFSIFRNNELSSEEYILTTFDSETMIDYLLEQTQQNEDKNDLLYNTILEEDIDEFLIINEL